jgi:APA family basic amino acid/polyamine antiporter
MPQAVATAAPTLERRLGSLDAAAIVVSNVIGGGILFTSPQVAAAVPHPMLFLLAWLAAGALTFAGALAYAELAAVRPKAGGEYVYLHAGFGRVAAFLTGWTSFVAGFSGAIAANSFFLALYLSRFIPVLGSDVALLSLPLGPISVTISPQTITAIVSVWVLTLIHVRGVGPGRVVGNVLASLKISALLLFIVAGFAFGTGSLDNLSTPAATPSAGSWLFALVPVLFAYAGWNAASYVAEEIRDPGRNVPRALALGTLAVIAIYLLLNALYLFVFPVEELAAIRGSVLDVIADRLLGTSAGNIMGIVSIISLLASNSAMILVGPRVYYAMARDGMFFPAAARVHPEYRTPATAIVAQAIWTTLLIVTGSGSALTTYTGFSILLFNGVAVAALFVLRRREPNAPRPYSTWGYPYLPALFVAVCAIIVANALYTDLVAPLTTGQSLGPSAAGLLIIGLGLPLYYWFNSGASSQR